MPVMHILMWRRHPIGMEMATHPARVQKQMHITTGQPPNFVEVLT